MKNIINFINESSNELKMSLGEVNINVIEISFTNDDLDIDLKSCDDEEIDDAVNSSEGTYIINFKIENYGEFNASIELNYDDVNIDLSDSHFKNGNYTFWNKSLNIVCDKYIGGLDGFGWSEDLLKELKRKVK